MLELSVKAEMILGHDMETALAHAACLARKLNIHHVEISGNGVDWHVFQNSAGVGFEGSKLAYRYTSLKGIHPA